MFGDEHAVAADEPVVGIVITVAIVEHTLARFIIFPTGTIAVIIDDTPAVEFAIGP